MTNVFLLYKRERRCWWLSDANFLGVCVCCRMFIREGNIYMASEALNVWAGIHILHIMVKQKTPDTCGYTCRKQQLVASWTKNTVQEGTWRNLKLNRHTKIYFRRLSSGVFDLNKKWGGCCCEQGKQDECRTWGIWLFMKNLQAVLLSFGNKLWSNTKTGPLWP